MANTVTVKSAMGFMILSGIALFPRSYDGVESLPMPSKTYIYKQLSSTGIKNLPDWTFDRGNVDVSGDEYGILNSFVRSILDNCIPLEADFCKVIDENFWDLV